MVVILVHVAAAAAVGADIVDHVSIFAVGK